MHKNRKKYYSLLVFCENPIFLPNFGFSWFCIFPLLPFLTFYSLLSLFIPFYHLPFQVQLWHGVWPNISSICCRLLSNDQMSLALDSYHYWTQPLIRATSDSIFPQTNEFVFTNRFNRAIVEVSDSTKVNIKTVRNCQCQFRLYMSGMLLTEKNEWSAWQM